MEANTSIQNITKFKKDDIQPPRCQQDMNLSKSWHQISLGQFDQNPYN